MPIILECDTCDFVVRGVDAMEVDGLKADGFISWDGRFTCRTCEAIERDIRKKAHESAAKYELEEIARLTAEAKAEKRNPSGHEPKPSETPIANLMGHAPIRNRP